MRDLGAEIIAIEFDGRVTVGDYRVASTQARWVLEEMRRAGVDGGRT